MEGGNKDKKKRENALLLGSRRKGWGGDIEGEKGRKRGRKTDGEEERERKRESEQEKGPY